MQRAIIVYFLTERKNNLSELNELLEQGWKVASQRPMGVGEGNNAAFSLVIIERD